MKPFPVILFCIAMSCFSSCRKGDLGINIPITPSAGRGVLIINEGSFPHPGTVAFYAASSDSVFENVVGTSAGWITPNDVKVIGKKAYIVVTGNDRLEILNTATFQSAGSIQFSPGTSPGILEIADSSTAFVANYSGTVSLVNLLSKSVVKTTGRIVGFPGGVVFSGGKVYVSDDGLYPAYNHIVKVLDASTLSLVDTISVGEGAGMMTRDSAGTVFVVCAGTYPSNGKVYAINTTSDIVTDSIGVGLGPSDIAMLRQSVLVLHGDRVMKLLTSPLRIADSSLVHLTNGLYFYAMNVDPSTENIYVSKIVSTGGSGELEIYASSGVLVRQPFAVGIFPGAFGFSY